jgi:hypothetical protein
VSGKNITAITVESGKTTTCTFTNTKRGKVTLLKLTGGAEDPTYKWDFTLKGTGVDASASTPPTSGIFNTHWLVPGDTYTLCEGPIPAGWTIEVKVDTNNDGTPDTIIPFAGGVNDSPVPAAPAYYGNVYDPKYQAPPTPYVNDTRCVKFKVQPGQTLAISINNKFPGGDPRTIGYWKNWNTCTGGGQVAVAAKNGGPAKGWYILDDLLNDPGYTLGLLVLDDGDCVQAQRILDKSDVVSGKKMASDAAYGLAAQLLAAELNVSAGAKSCQPAFDAINAGLTLLADIKFTGKGAFLNKSNTANYQLANSLAATLDRYNNGLLCP